MFPQQRLKHQKNKVHLQEHLCTNVRFKDITIEISRFKLQHQGLVILI